MRRRHSLPLALVAAAAVALVGTGRASACGGRPYTYAGISGTRPAAGIGAAVSALAVPHVASGHVAAFVGVGGPGLGPDGSDEWLQIGLSGFSTGESSVYYEVARPGAAPLYTELKANVRRGETHRIAVLEVRGRPGWWRVWLDGRAVSRPIELPESHDRFVPLATAESWTPGASSCNSYAFGFGRVSIASVPGGSWSRLLDHYAFSDAGYRVVARSPATFVAVAAPGARQSRELVSVRR